MDRDHNLLFGVFAVQLKKVTPTQFVDVAAAWAADPSRNLPERMVENAFLSEPDRILLENLASEALRHHRGNSAEALEAFGGEEQVSRILALSHEAKDVAAAATKLGVPLVPESDDLQYSAVINEEPGRYSRSSEHSHGGMGRILLVHDRCLGRDIVLKELLPFSSPADSTCDRQIRVGDSLGMSTRFVREARITGQLEHPSIVPVYEVGRRANGTLYYTMKLIRGRSLEKVLEETSSFAERQTLLPHFIDLCQAIAYAHSRQVIHRDIKPSNVMVGQFGETVVIDWGLARVLGQEDPQAQDLEKTTLRLREDRPENVELTAHGTRLGTPHYMSPEQAEGRIEEIDERSDVFSLGAVLYELLAGRHLFAGKSTREILERVVSQEAPPVRSVAPEVSPELASICHKALQKDPEARYPSAKAMAEDLERFRSGALVHAYPYSPGQLVKHYYRRHRTVFNALFAAVGAVLVVVAYSYVRILNARDREHAQRLAAERESYVAQIRLAQSLVRDRNVPLANQTLWRAPPENRDWEWGYLLNQCNMDLLTIEGVSGARYGPDGTRLLTLSRTKPPALWNTGTWKVETSLEEAPGKALSGKFSPDGERVVIAFWDRTARIWDSRRGRPLAVLRGHAGPVQSAEFDPNGLFVVTASSDGTAKVWDSASGSELATLRGHSSIVWRAHFSSDGTRILTVSDDGTTRVWNGGSGSELFTVPGGRAQFSPDGAHLLVVVNDEVLIYDAVTGQRGATLAGHEAAVMQAHFSPDGRHVVTASADGTARVWDSASGDLVRVFEHPGKVAEAVFSPDGQLLLTFSADGPIRIWDAETARELACLRGHSGAIRTAEFAPQSTRVVSTAMDRTVKVWHPRIPLGSRGVTRHKAPVAAVSVSRDKTQVGTISIDGVLQVTEPGTGRRAAVCATRGRADGCCVAFSPDGRHVLGVLDRFTPSLWEIESQTLVRLFPGHSGEVRSVAFSPDGRGIVTASWDRTARVWDTETGYEVFDLRGHADMVHCASYVPGGRHILTASEDKTVIVWDAEFGQKTVLLDEHDGPVCAVAYSPDGSKMATASSDETAIVWQVDTWAPMVRLTGHGDGLRGVSFSSDGSRIATSSWDGTVKIWDAASGDELVTLVEDARWFTAVGFGLGDRRLLTASDDGVVNWYEAAPFRRTALPGDDSMTWQDRFALYKRMAIDDAPLTASSIEVAPLVVATSCETLRDGLSRLHDAIAVERQDFGTNIPEPDGLWLGKGPRLEAVACLRFLADDEIVHIGGMEIRDLDGALEALAQAGRSTEAAAGQLAMGVVRNHDALEVRFVYREPIRLRVERTLDSQKALEILRWERQMLAEDADTLLEVNQDNAQRLGRPTSGPDALNGLWVLSVHTMVEGDYYLSLGIAPGDRIVKLDGRPVTSLGELRGWYEQAIDKLEAGQVFAFDWELERGEFQRVTVAVTVR